MSQSRRRFSQADYDVLPHRLVLVRHAQSEGNVDMAKYGSTPDHMVALTDLGRKQAIDAGIALRAHLKAAHPSKLHPPRVYIMTSPYARTLETTDMMLNAFDDSEVMGVRSVVQLREQDFGNFQDAQRIKHDLNERLRFGRFWFRFPNGESGADVYDRLSMFEDKLTRDMLLARFADTSVVLVTHGLTLRILLMKWFHWTVEELLQVYNPHNCDPIFMVKLPWEDVQVMQSNGEGWVHLKQAYCLCPSSVAKMRNVTPRMASYYGRAAAGKETGERISAKAAWQVSRGIVQPGRERDTQEALAYLSGLSSVWGEADPHVQAHMLRAKAALLGSDEERWFVTVDDGDFWAGESGRSQPRIDDN
ncbi:hypothetical protein FOA52_009997 [Chlamydomonas sp. UWO 241]|nr:hypothetical protein FOA52_009997 [Chlamydomonas sp. UWO 241]